MTNKTYVGEVLSVRVVECDDGVFIVKEYVNWVDDEGKAFGVAMALLKHDGTWSSKDDFPNTNYKFHVKRDKG